MPCKEKKKDKNMLRIFLYPSFFKSQHTVHYSIESWSNLSWTVIIILWKPWTAMGQTISSVLLQQCTEYSFSHNHKLFTSLSRNAFTSYHDKTKPCSYLLLKEINSALPACVHNILTSVATDVRLRSALYWSVHQNEHLFCMYFFGTPCKQALTLVVFKKKFPQANKKL